MKRSTQRSLDIETFADSIESREDFEEFMRLLLIDFSGEVDSWENQTLDSFLEALWAFTGSLEAYYRNTGQAVDLDQPSWKVFADLLLAARVYE